MKKITINVLTIAATIFVAIVLGLQLPKFLHYIKGPFKTGIYSVHIQNQPYKLSLYGTTTCKYCAAARTFLKQKGIPFNDLLVDQSKSVSTLFSTLQEPAVPVLVSEKKLVVGFRQEEYEEFLKTK